MEPEEVMRGLVFAAKLRGAESFEEALAWMVGQGYVVERDGDYYPTAKGTQRAENILNPRRLDASDHRLLYGWARELRTAQLEGKEIPDFADSDAVLAWLEERELLGGEQPTRCREIIGAGLLSYAAQTT